MVSFAELGTVESRTDVLPPGGSATQHIVEANGGTQHGFDSSQARFAAPTARPLTAPNSTSAICFLASLIVLL